MEGGLHVENLSGFGDFFFSSDWLYCIHQRSRVDAIEYRNNLSSIINIPPLTLAQTLGAMSMPNHCIGP